MTKREMFTAIRSIVADNADMVTFIDKEIALLDKKRTSAKKPTQTQIDNEGFKADIVAFLTDADAPKCIKELQTEIPSISGLTNQRITHLLTDLVKGETLVKAYVKKVPYFSIKA